MKLAISFSAKSKAKFDTTVVFAAKGNLLTPAAAALDKEAGGLIAAYLKRQKAFTGKAGQSLTLAAQPNQDFARIVVIGLGDAAELDAVGAETIGEKIFAALKAAGAENANLLIDAPKGLKTLDEAALGSYLALGASLGAYVFDQYRSKKKESEDAPKLAKLHVVSKNAAKAESAYRPLAAAAAGVALARDLTNLPPNDLYPDSYAKRIRAELAPLGVKIDIFDEKKLAQMGFGAHLAVGQGSLRPPRLVVMQWNGASSAKKPASPVALVGKGITFDTGGISLKPGAGMDEMKMDMGGSAAVVGAMRLLAARKARANVIGIVALAENMPSDRAYRPGDIITSLSGKTVEVLNTDAEGRLVLCDALTYVQNTYRPCCVIDLATLTGAIIVALGHEYCGSFVNDDTLWNRLEQSGKAVGEKYWRMPLDKAYRKDVESKVADLRNIGSQGKAGSCTAAGFLEHFIEDGTAWAHLDIAGTGMSSAKGGTGFAVRTLDRLIADHYEK